jgi:hypothetical protein
MAFACRLRWVRIAPSGARHGRGARGARAPRGGHGEAELEARGERHRGGQVDRDDGVDGHVARHVLDRADDRVPGDGDARPVVLELVAELPRRVQRVVLDDDRAEAQHRVERDDVLGAVRQHERHAVARAHAQPPEPLRGAGDLVAQLAVGRLAPEELERHGLGVPLDGAVDHVDQRSDHGRDVGRHPVRIAAYPRAVGV